MTSKRRRRFGSASPKRRNECAEPCAAANGSGLSWPLLPAASAFPPPPPPSPAQRPCQPSAVAELGVVRPMRRALVVAAVTLAGLLVMIFLLGGVHHSRFTRYVPTSVIPSSSESQYVPALHPGFSRTTSPLHETLIPYFIYRHSEPDHDPRIYLTIQRAGEPGFRGASTLAIQSLTVRNESGTEFRLVTASSPRTFKLPSQYIWRQEDLGAISGDLIDLRADGYILTETGAKNPFTYAQHWRKTASTCNDLGIMISE